VEVFPTAIRATCHGIAAASGKIGATLGAAMFKPMSDAYGDPLIFIMCAVISWLGALLTLFLVYDGPEDPKVLDDDFYTLVKDEYMDPRRGAEDPTVNYMHVVDDEDEDAFGFSNSQDLAS